MFPDGGVAAAGLRTLGQTPCVVKPFAGQRPDVAQRQMRYAEVTANRLHHRLMSTLRRILDFGPVPRHLGWNHEIAIRVAFMAASPPPAADAKQVTIANWPAASFQLVGIPQCARNGPTANIARFRSEPAPLSLGRGFLPGWKSGLQRIHAARVWFSVRRSAATPAHRRHRV